MEQKSVGQPVNRQDGRLKVTGAAKYSAEWSLPNMSYAVPVQSAIAKGTIDGFDLTAAQAVPGVLTITLGLQQPSQAEEEIEQATTQTTPPGTIPVTLKVNGKRHTLNLDPRTTLLDALRENMGMTGSKKGCDHGQCGACTVHIDGQRSLSCLALAAQQDGSDIVTIEGLAKGDSLHPVQQAFLDHDGYQCGYCTPGQIMSAVALLREGHAKTDAEIREGMSGNLCRCAAYPHIVAAVKAARDSGKRI